MAGRTLTVDMADDDVIPAWRTVIDLAATGMATRLTLVGGLMVAAHARRAGVIMRRPTDDVDALVDYLADRSSLNDVRAALASMGFALSDDEQYAYRFRHPDGRKVDVMVADHLPSRMQPRLARRPAFPAPSGEQAIRRRDNYRLVFAGGAMAEVGVPNELGALVAKGAAYQVDRRDRERHLDDAAVLLASIGDASALDYGSMSSNDRRRIAGVAEQLADERHRGWINLDPLERSHARLNLTLITRALTV
ncbi:MAG: hypothetical protein ACYC6C_08100 [Coriobacteriia bacterium]